MKWIRPIISFIAITGMTAGFFLDKIDPIAYATLATATVIFWFKSRDEEKRNHQ